jgi:hypothetical protein
MYKKPCISISFKFLNIFNININNILNKDSGLENFSVLYLDSNTPSKNLYLC